MHFSVAAAQGERKKRERDGERETERERERERKREERVQASAGLRHPVAKCQSFLKHRRRRVIMVQPLVKKKIVKKFGRKFKRYQHDRKIAVKVRPGRNVNETKRTSEEKRREEKDKEGLGGKWANAG